MTSPQYYCRTVLVDTREHILISNLGIFQQRMSPGSGAFSLAFNFPAMHYQICIIGKCLYSFKRDDSCLKILDKTTVQECKNPLPVNMHSSKTTLLTLSTIYKGYKEGEFDKTKTPNLYQES